MRIDAHQHFWELKRNDYGWLTADSGLLFRDYGPDDLRPLLQQHQIDRTILIQAAQTIDETRYLLKIAADHPFVAGVIGWVALDQPDVVDRLSELTSDPKFRGVRPMLQDLPRDDWLTNSARTEAIDYLIDHNLTFDALVHLRHLPYLFTFASKHPRLPIVIDHSAKPPIASGHFREWAEGLAPFARLPNVSCKLSGLTTEAGDHWSVDTLRPYVDHVTSVFGPRRVVWGSDWPVVNLHSDYTDWRQISDQLLSSFCPVDLEAIYGINAERIYGL